MDLFEKLTSNMGPLALHADAAKGYYTFPKLEGEIAPRMMFNGEERLIWSLNNYLGLANHPEVRKADADATAVYGLAYPMGARMMSGNTTNHELYGKIIEKCQQYHALPKLASNPLRPVTELILLCEENMLGKLFDYLAGKILQHGDAVLLFSYIKIM